MYDFSQLKNRWAVRANQVMARMLEKKFLRTGYNVIIRHKQSNMTAPEMREGAKSKWRTGALSRPGSSHHWEWSRLVHAHRLCRPQNFPKQHSYITTVTQTHQMGGTKQNRASHCVLMTVMEHSSMPRYQRLNSSNSSPPATPVRFAS